MKEQTKTKKIGIKYFGTDTDIFMSKTIKKLLRKYNSKGFLILYGTLCELYRKGFYLKWEKDTAFEIADMISFNSGINEEIVTDVIKDLILWDFFDKDLFEKHHILTHRNIQERYILANRKSFSHVTYLANSEYCLLGMDESKCFEDLVAISGQTIIVTKKEYLEKAKKTNLISEAYYINNKNDVCFKYGKYKDEPIIEHSEYLKFWQKNNLPGATPLTIKEIYNKFGITINMEIK
jgi:hypothetical protein